MRPEFDTLIQNGLFFDGSGADGVRRDLAIRDGRIACVSEAPIASHRAADTIDARGCWVTPGFIDLHTHYDAEVELLPGLTESVRHGVTTIAMGSCSLSLAVGDPVELADMFCRVEAIPRHVVKPLLQARKDWDGPADYFRHLETLPLGPNVAAFLGHSTIRAHVMGLGRSLEHGITPTEAEMRRMEALLEEALDAGYLGLSIMTLHWDKMDGELYRSRPLPSVFAKWREYRRLNRMLRARGRIFQGVPNVTTKVNAFLFLLESIGMVRPALKTSIISMMDARADRLAYRLAGVLARVCNRWLGADFKLQALPEVFDLWADGIDVVVFEEFGAGAAALHLQDPEARARLLTDPDYRRQFKRQWRRLLSPRAFHRKLELTQILECPDKSLVGRTFTEVAKARGQDDVDTFLDLIATYGPALRWYTVMANDRKWALEKIVAHPDAQIGFSDAGAHLRNMAHYNFPLRMLRLVKEAADRGAPIMTLGQAVRRLTSELGDWLGIDAGRLEPGRRADLVVVDPAGLDDSLEAVEEAEMRHFGGLKRLVRRNDRAVPAVLINGKVAFRQGALNPVLGQDRGFGRLLRAGQGGTA